MSNDRLGSVISRLYYILGFSYYLYKWLLLGGFTGFLVSGYLYLTSPGTGPLLLFFIALIVFVPGAIYGISALRSRYRATNPGIRILNVDVCYAHLGNNNYKTTRVISAQVTRHGTDHYMQKFSWSGNGDFKPSTKNSKFSIEVQNEKFGTKKVCKVFFDRPMKRGELVIIDYEVAMVDNIGTAQHYLAAYINEKIHKALTLRLAFTQQDNPSKCFKETFLSGVSDIPFMEKEESISAGSHEVSWEISKPRLHYRYRLRYE